MNAAVSLHCEVVGEGPNVLLVSGLNGTAQFWRPVTTRLSNRFRLATFDQRGCGMSADDGANWTIATMANDAAAVAAHVFGAAPFAIVGHSAGGAIAQMMPDRKHEQIEAIVFSGTWSQPDPYFDTLFRLRLSLIDRAPDLDSTLTNILRTEPIKFRPTENRVTLKPEVTRRRILALLAYRGKEVTVHLKMPCLVVAAADDRIVPIHLSQTLADTLPSASMIVSSEGGHFFPQSQPDWFCDSVGDWLESTLNS